MIPELQEIQGTGTVTRDDLRGWQRSGLWTILRNSGTSEGRGVSNGSIRKGCYFKRNMLNPEWKMGGQEVCLEVQRITS